MLFLPKVVLYCSMVEVKHHETIVLGYGLCIHFSGNVASERDLKT